MKKLLKLIGKIAINSIAAYTAGVMYEQGRRTGSKKIDWKKVSPENFGARIGTEFSKVLMRTMAKKMAKAAEKPAPSPRANEEDVQQGFSSPW